MGWWSQDRTGRSFATESEMVWGDGPADTLADACAAILGEFQEAVGRRPTNAEIRAGLEFHLRGLPDEQEYGKES